ncbi:hypothetical protein PRIPAC_82126, partial [Pristionchus pacificus]|uniref:Uncharacterized protein n=1 Tax=Pristionchus pacificus TaxID=54126 RepID=A0A2A6CK88_PRIPA
QCSLRKSLLLVLLFNLITCHKHLLPKELMLIGGGGISSPSSTVRGGRFKRGWRQQESQRLESSAQSFIRVGTMNAMKIADLDYKMRRIYALHMADKFAAELDRAFVSHELSGIVLAGFSKSQHCWEIRVENVVKKKHIHHFMESTGMNSINEVRARTKIYIDHCCVGDVMVAHVVHSDPFNTIRGSLLLTPEISSSMKNSMSIMTFQRNSSFRTTTRLCRLKNASPRSATHRFAEEEDSDNGLDIVEQKGTGPRITTTSRITVKDESEYFAHSPKKGEIRKKLGRYDMWASECEILDRLFEYSSKLLFNLKCRTCSERKKLTRCHFETQKKGDSMKQVVYDSILGQSDCQSCQGSRQILNVTSTAWFIPVDISLQKESPSRCDEIPKEIK